MQIRNLVYLLSLICALIGCSSKNNWNNYKDGSNLVIEIEQTDDDNINSLNLQKINTLLVQRLYDFGIREILTKTEGKDRLIVQFPRKMKLRKEIYDLILKQYKLEFKIVNEDYNVKRLDKGNLPKDIQLLHMSKNGSSLEKQLIVVNKKVLLTGDYIVDAKVEFDKYTEKPYVAFEFDKEGARLFEIISANNIKKQLAIILDGEVYAAPVIQSKISGGHAILSGWFSDEEAKILSICLRQGAYPARVNLIAENRITKDTWLGNKEVQ
jgi:preprotein translocase subunit SecD